MSYTYYYIHRKPNKTIGSIYRFNDEEVEFESNRAYVTNSDMVYYSDGALEKDVELEYVLNNEIITGNANLFKAIFKWFIYQTLVIILQYIK